jgi:hypothetical protein
MPRSAICEEDYEWAYDNKTYLELQGDRDFPISYDPAWLKPNQDVIAHVVVFQLETQLTITMPSVHIGITEVTAT